MMRVLNCCTQVTYDSSLSFSLSCENMSFFLFIVVLLWACSSFCWYLYYTYFLLLLLHKCIHTVGSYITSCATSDSTMTFSYFRLSFILFLFCFLPWRVTSVFYFYFSFNLFSLYQTQLFWVFLILVLLMCSVHFFCLWVSVYTVQKNFFFLYLCFWSLMNSSCFLERFFLSSAL